MSIDITKHRLDVSVIHDDGELANDPVDPEKMDDKDLEQVVGTIKSESVHHV